MKEFMMVFRNGGVGDSKPTPEQINAVEKQWADWIGGIVAKGKYVGGPRPMPDGKTIMPGNIITDGPYAEVKEILMGIALIKADNMEDALETAKGCPILLVGGNVEVRQVMMNG